MKKTLLTLILMFVIAVLVVGPASAQNGKVYIKGELISVGDRTLIVNSYKGETFSDIVCPGPNSIPRSSFIVTEPLAERNDTGCRTNGLKPTIHAP